MNIAQPDVLAFDTEFQQHVQASNARRAATCGYDLDVLEFLARYKKRVLHGGTNDNRRAVLVVVENRYVHPLAADAFHGKAVGGLDVFEVDRAKGRFQRADQIGELFRIGLVKFDIETVDIGELFEQDGFALHHRLGRKRADVAKPQDCGAVGDNAHQIRAGGIEGSRCGISLDFKAGFGDAGGIGPRQITAICQRFRRTHFEFSGLGKGVIVQRGLAQIWRIGHVLAVL